MRRRTHRGGVGSRVINGKTGVGVEGVGVELSAGGSEGHKGHVGREGRWGDVGGNAAAQALAKEMTMWRSNGR